MTLQGQTIAQFIKCSSEILQSPKVLSKLKDTISLPETPLPKTPTAPRKMRAQSVSFDTPIIIQSTSTTLNQSIHVKKRKDRQTTALKEGRISRATAVPVKV